MAMSDCEKCWETPCVCGHSYRNRSEAWIEDLIATLQRVLAEKRAVAQGQSEYKPEMVERLIRLKDAPPVAAPKDEAAFFAWLDRPR